MNDADDPRRDAPPGHDPLPRPGRILPFEGLRLLASANRGDPADPGTGGGVISSGRTKPGATAGDFFTVLWEALADILGTAAAATLLRRAAQRAARGCPELAGLAITRESHEYRYAVPAAWRDPAPETPAALRGLVRELRTLLVDLTGPVVVDRLAQVPELRELGILPSEREGRP